MTVTALRTVRQTGDECPVCGGKNGKHELIKVPYPYPLNLCVFKYIRCPMEEGDLS